MTMPGFHAEASLYVTTGRYATAGTAGAPLAHVVPQMGGTLDALAYPSSCDRACRCCAWGNHFCCRHCRWCSWP